MARPGAWVLDVDNRRVAFSGRGGKSFSTAVDGSPTLAFDQVSPLEFSLERTPTTYDRERGSIQFFGAVPDGATIQLTMAGTDQIFEGAKASFADALAAFPSGVRPDGALLFSCATRKYLLGTRAGREIELARGGDAAVRFPGRQPIACDVLDDDLDRPTAENSTCDREIVAAPADTSGGFTGRSVRHCGTCRRSRARAVLGAAYDNETGPPGGISNPRPTDPKSVALIH